MKQTAVEFIKELFDIIFYYKDDDDDERLRMYELFEQAKEIEKEQIISFGEWYSGMEKEKVHRAYNRYLNETTFKSE